MKDEEDSYFDVDVTDVPDSLTDHYAQNDEEQFPAFDHSQNVKSIDNGSESAEFAEFRQVIFVACYVMHQIS
jgi:hypothetical protein